MALPVTISGATMPAGHYYCGPFISSAGAYYALLIETTGSRPEVLKATDPTTSFSVVDSANRPAAVPWSVWGYQVGDVLHIATQETQALGGDVHYHTFNLATDAWVIKDELVETPTNAPPDAQAGASLVVRSDGDVIVCYSGDTDIPSMNAKTRVDYARREGGSWTVGIALDGAGDDNWAPGPAFLGASDRTHFGLADQANLDNYVRTLLSNNTLQALPAAYILTVRGAAHYPAPSTPFLSGAETRTVSMFLENIGNAGRPSGVRWDSADTLTFTVNSDPMSSAHAGVLLNGTIVFCCVTDQTTVYFLFTATADSDLYTLQYTDGVGWAATAVSRMVGTINRVSGNVYTRAGRIVIGYLVLDTTTVKYNEIDLREAPAAGGALRTRLLRGVGA